MELQVVNYKNIKGGMKRTFLEREIESITVAIYFLPVCNNFQLSNFILVHRSELLEVWIIKRYASKF